MDYFNKVKNKLKLNISDELLISLVFEMTRKKDKEFVVELQETQKENDVIFNTIMRNKIRKFYYFENFLQETEEFVQLGMNTLKYNQTEKEEVFKDFYERLNTYNPERIINSIKTNIKDLENGNSIGRHADDWLDFYKEKYSSNHNALTIYRINQDEFKNNNYNNDFINDFIFSIYDELINYRYLSIVFEGELTNDSNENVTWPLIYKTGIYAENFVQYTDRFIPFKQDKQISVLSEFLRSREISNYETIANNFYSTMSYGFKFEDLYISDNQEIKILILKKIQLDNTEVPCPSCNTGLQRGNSYPEVFLRSWECTNPSCPDRSKSGRGKRFDEFGTYRFFKLAENDPLNRIDDEMYTKWRRDIFDENSNWKEFLIKNYSYAEELVLVKNLNIDNTYGRDVTNQTNISENKDDNKIKGFSNLPIFKLFNEIYTNKQNRSNRIKVLTNDIEIVNADSAKYLNNLMPNQIGAAITSPPYYNAREYSQWENMILYFVDMLLNADAVYNSLSDDSYYLYNIGDIVAEDNVYVVSLMSKKRIQLGFLSSMIFEIIGFNLSGNIIWDKGQVQSKRNSTVNMFSGYVKCINSYEHVLVFKKGIPTYNPSKVVEINPVIKINSKGENTYKHTAPYPLELVDLVREFSKKDSYILDPYLGSGTTVKWAFNNGYKGLGIELNEDYYKLSKINVFNKKV